MDNKTFKWLDTLYSVSSKAQAKKRAVKNPKNKPAYADVETPGFILAHKEGGGQLCYRVQDVWLKVDHFTKVPDSLRLALEADWPIIGYDIARVMKFFEKAQWPPPSAWYDLSDAMATLNLPASRKGIAAHVPALNGLNEEPSLTRLTLSHACSQWGKYFNRDRDAWHLHMGINARGVQLDLSLIQKVIRLMPRVEQELAQKAGGSIPGTRQELTIRLNELGHPDSDTSVSGLIKALAETQSPAIQHVINAWLFTQQVEHERFGKIFDQCDKASRRLVDAYDFQGAHTGRWSSKGIAMQNIKKPLMGSEQLRECIQCVLEENAEDLLNAAGTQHEFECLSALIRSVFIGRPLVVSDFSQMELRVLLFMCNDDIALQEIVDQHPYLLMGRVLFGRDIQKNTKGHIQ